MVQLKLALSIEEFATAVGISRSQTYVEIRHGRLTVAKAGKRTLVPATEAQRWLDQMTMKGARK